MFRSLIGTINRLGKECLDPEKIYGRTENVTAMLFGQVLVPKELVEGTHYVSTSYERILKTAAIVLSAFEPDSEKRSAA